MYSACLSARLLLKLRKGGGGDAIHVIITILQVRSILDCIVNTIYEPIDAILLTQIFKNCK